MAIDPQELIRLQADAEALEAGFKTLLLSTLGPEQQPASSYSPYVRSEGSYYVFISELSEHTQHLMAHGKCSVMFIADERDSRNLFARERLIFNCEAAQVERQSDEGQRVLSQMKEELGETIALLTQLGDFRLFRLSPIKGRYVVGFGKAFIVDGPTRTLSHIDADSLKK